MSMRSPCTKKLNRLHGNIFAANFDAGVLSKALLI